MLSNLSRASRTLIAHPDSPQEKHYQLLGILGEGGAGITYRAQAEDMASPVAVKMLTLCEQANWDDIQRFDREAKLLAKLQHPSIPRYVDYFYIDTDTDRTFCIVQQLAEGQSLAKRVKAGWRCNEDTVKAIAAQLLKILIYLHTQPQPVIHRDLKPQNIIMNDEGKVFLVDFGAVQTAYYDTFMQGHTMVGAYGYMAPEQFRGQAAPGTDLYGLGATLLFLLTRRSPADFPLEGLKLNLKEHLSISENLGLWLAKLLEPDIAERFPSAEAALTALQNGMPRPAKQSMTKQDALAIFALSVLALGLLNQYKFPVLSALGFTPREMFEQGINGGNVAVVERYLDLGVSPNSRAYNGNTLLHWAVSNNQPDVVSLLLERGANLHQTYKPDDRTVLHLAVQHDNPVVAELLLQHGARIDVRDRDGDTPLHKVLLKNDVHYYYGMTNNSGVPSKEIVRLLTTAGAKVDVANRRGQTPLEIATQKGLAHLLTHPKNL
ncbi:MAG: ankyrin repeat domain-containing protein [Leptolyngbyaceae cyanobacterium MO_188.B28]|nr:ankyrin repeat domain-containing protein [Leptolyngbyaceae cyanobacterium MO_188.B28]